MGIKSQKQQEFDANFEVDSKYSQEEVMNVIKESTGDKEIATYEYPNSVEQLMNFLSEKGYDFKENDFLLTNENYGVDADGYPYIKHLIMLMPVCLEINMTVYHHTKWDFYLDDVADFRNNID